MTPAEFRVLYPEFSQASYPDETVQRWSALALLRMDPLRWGELTTEGRALFIAHNLALGGPVAGQPGVPGSSVGGLVASKSISKVSLSFDTSSLALEGAGNFNLSRYGRDWWQLSAMVGLGGVQL
jgi:hypothetical protein